MKSNRVNTLTQAQNKTIAQLRLQVAAENPKAEIKSFDVVSPIDSPIPQVARMAIVTIELGFVGDEGDYRRHLRIRQTWLVSVRGRAEQWSKRGFTPKRQRRRRIRVTLAHAA